MTVEQVITICLTLITGLGGGSVIIWALSSWLGKVWANRILEKDRLKYNRELEVVKNELGRASQEYLIKFSNLHIERACIIKELYIMLVSAEEQLYSILKQFQATGEPSMEDKIKAFVKSFNEFYQYYLKHRIYFSEQICGQIKAFALMLRDIHIDITTYPIALEDLEYKHLPELQKERKEYWDSARSKFDSKSVALFQSIETEFRGLLGVKNT